MIDKMFYGERCPKCKGLGYKTVDTNEGLEGAKAICYYCYGIGKPSAGEDEIAHLIVSWCEREKEIGHTIDLERMSAVRQLAHAIAEGITK